MRKSLLAAACVLALGLQGAVPVDAKTDHVRGVVRAKIHIAIAKPSVPGRDWPVRQEAKAEPPASVAPPTPSPGFTSMVPNASGCLNASEVASYAQAAGFPESVIPTMVAIAARESGYCPGAVYGYGANGWGHAYAGGPACGIWELYPCPGPQALNPATNAALAYAKYEASGFSPWGG